MKRLSILLVAGLLCGFTQTIKQVYPVNPATGLVISNGVIVSNVAINTAATSTQMLVEGYTAAMFSISHTNSGATAVTFYCEHSFDRSTWYRIPTRSCSSGTCTLADRTDSFAVSGNDTFESEWGLNYKYMRCVVLGTGAPDGNDKATVTALLAVL